MEISNGRVQLERYWDPLPEDRPIQWLTTDEAAHFGDVLDRAVDRCLGNGPTGIFLSGGLDSVSVAAVAKDRARRSGCPSPLALSVAFPDPACDERERQSTVAKQLGLQHKMLTMDEAIGSTPIFEQSLAMGRGFSAPLLNAWLPAYAALAQRGRPEGVQTILTGQGGDEWLSVSPFLSADLISSCDLLELARFYGNLRRSHERGPLTLLYALLWTFGLRPLAAAAAYRLAPQTIEAYRLERMFRAQPEWIAPDPELRAEQRRRAEGSAYLAPPQGFYAREMRTALTHTLVSWEAEEQYEFGKQVGVRFLHPFWDPDLVEMLARIPPRLLNEGGASKGIVRGTLAQRFPLLGFERQRKVTATSYFRSCLMEAAPAFIDAVGEFPSLSDLGIIHGRSARAFLLNEVKQGQQLLRIYHAIGVEMWIRSHNP